MSRERNDTLSISFHHFEKIDPLCIWVTKSVIPAKDTVYASGYVDHAYIPRMEWNKLSKNKFDQIRLNSFRTTHDSVGIIKFDELKVMELTKAAYRAHVDPELEGEVRDLFFNTISEKVSIEGAIKYLGVETTFDSAPTLTWENDGRKTGLHVDSWYSKDINKRKKSPNRMCLNISTTERYFLMINKQIEDIKNELLQHSMIHENDSENVTALTVAYLSEHPNTEVIAIRTRPGEAYIAPTENIIHDGFVPSRIQNSSISFMGYIKPKLQPLDLA